MEWRSNVGSTSGHPGVGDALALRSASRTAFGHCYENFRTFVAFMEGGTEERRMSWPRVSGGACASPMSFCERVVVGIRALVLFIPQF